jgi:TolB-like protein/Tfp pilus assembly protein PilF
MPPWPSVFSSITVAVAPLRNLTSDSHQQYLVDAFADDLVTDLIQGVRRLPFARIADARRRPDNLPQTAEPQIDYVITGSARHGSLGKLRIDLRITDAAEAARAWAGRYEVSAKELALPRTKITRRISRELEILLLQEASRRAVVGSGGGLRPLGLNECLSRAANALAARITPELTAEAQRWFLAALAVDPRDVEALTGLALTCQRLASQPWWGDFSAVSMASALGCELVAIALEIAPEHARAKCVQGMLYSGAGQLEQAARAFEEALAIDQGLAIAHGWAGYNAAFLGRADETPPAIKRAISLERVDRTRSIWFFFGGFSELLRGRTEASVALLRKSLELNPSYGSARLFLTAALSLSGRRTEAGKDAASFREQNPEYRASVLNQQWLWRSTSATYRAQIYPLLGRIRNLGIGA